MSHLVSKTSQLYLVLTDINVRFIDFVIFEFHFIKLRCGFGKTSYQSYDIRYSSYDLVS